jgi:hypothetical protein
MSDGPVTLSDVEGTEIRGITQQMVPFNIPLGLPLVNPFSQKQMRFRKQYKVTNITVPEGVNGVLFSNYRPFMDVQRETYNRAARTRNLVFNPFMVEMEQMGRRTGEIGASAGRGVASMMGAGLGLIEWKISVDPASTPERVSIRYGTTNNLFKGHFRINVIAAPGGIVLEDDWTPEGGADMRTGFLLMANLVLFTHPKGFEQIAAQMVAEIKRARTSCTNYVGEIGPPSVEEKS